MSADRARAAGWKAVAEVRALQSRAAEMAAIRAGNARGEAARTHERSEAALDEAHDGWAGAVEGSVFDPDLAGHWLALVGRRRAAEQDAGEALNEAGRTLAAKSAARHAAEARAEVAVARHGEAEARAARRGDEARLATVEDRAARRGAPR
jgi:hypothetical protein